MVKLKVNKLTLLGFIHQMCLTSAFDLEWSAKLNSPKVLKNVLKIQSKQQRKTFNDTQVLKSCNSSSKGVNLLSTKKNLLNLNLFK